jgi:protein required for attachment to host cells
MTRTKRKEKNNLIKEIIESEVKDRELIIKASRTIDNLRNRYGKSVKEFNSTEILRKIREGQIK